MEILSRLMSETEKKEGECNLLSKIKNKLTSTNDDRVSEALIVKKKDALRRLSYFQDLKQTG
ncbi:hypothetical protein ACSZMD_14540 [Aeromonas veronii]